MWICTFCGYRQETDPGEDCPLCPLCLVQLVEEIPGRVTDAGGGAGGESRGACPGQGPQSRRRRRGGRPSPGANSGEGRPWTSTYGKD